MPVHCSLKIERLTTQAFGELDYEVTRHIFDSQSRIGRLADERVYQADVFNRLSSARIEVPIELKHKSFEKELYIDLVVSNQAVYEFKTVSTLNQSHIAQLLTYLYLLDIPRGKLVNFRTVKVESQFVNAPIPRADRCGFSVSSDYFFGDPSFMEMVVGLVRDWGTSLSPSLYHEAMVHLLGGQDAVECMLPMHRDGVSLSNQRFNLLDKENAFVITTFSRPEKDYKQHLNRLLDMSALISLHWVNVDPHCVTFMTIDK